MTVRGGDGLGGKVEGGSEIDPATGKVTAAIDLRPLVAEVAATDPEAVLNGIAWDAKADRLFVTGKYWPTLFEIKIAAKPQ